MRLYHAEVTHYICENPIPEEHRRTYSENVSLARVPECMEQENDTYTYLTDGITWEAAL